MSRGPSAIAEPLVTQYSKIRRRKLPLSVLTLLMRESKGSKHFTCSLWRSYFFILLRVNADIHGEIIRKIVCHLYHFVPGITRSIIIALYCTGIVVLIVWTIGRVSVLCTAFLCLSDWLMLLYTLYYFITVLAAVYNMFYRCRYFIFSGRPMRRLISQTTEPFFTKGRCRVYGTCVLSSSSSSPFNLSS